MTTNSTPDSASQFRPEDMQLDRPGEVDGHSPTGTPVVVLQPPGMERPVFSPSGNGVLDRTISVQI